MHTESGSIVLGLLASQYVAGLEQHPSPQSIYWSHFSEGTMMLHLQPARVLGIFTDAISKRLSPEAARGARALNDMFRSRWADHNIQIQLDTVEDYLRNNEHFTGTKDIGIGDVRFPSCPHSHQQFMMLFPISAALDGFRKGEFSIGPNTRRWVDAMRQRPAYRNAIERQSGEEAKIRESAAKL